MLLRSETERKNNVKETTMVAAMVMAAGIMGGCGTHYKLSQPEVSFERMGLINDPAQVGRLEKAVTDGDIARLLDVDVRAKLPTKVALARVVRPSEWCPPALAQISAEELKQWDEIAEAQRYITGVQPVSPLAVGAGGDGNKNLPSLHSLRLAAARMNCELLLVYVRADSSVDNFNSAAALYWTVVGLWLAPGNVLEHQTVIQGILVDCRTGMILGTATGDSHLKESTAAAYTSIVEDKLRRQAPKDALADFREGCKRLLADVVLEAARGRS